MPDKAQVVPIEVKSDSGTTLKSMHMFLESHSKTTYDLRFSTQNYSIYNNIQSYPLYAVPQMLLVHDLQELANYTNLLTN